MNSSIRSSRPVAIWLLIGVFMIIVQIILGGITRLTDSGLSITEWKPLLGTLPPLNETQWNEAFDGYKQIAQFKHLHSDFTLSDFKSIFFWEWLHRLWGRLIGVAFLIPFLIFIFQRRFSKDMIRPMVILFLLGGLQGLIGWLMVVSGLNDENLYVSHIRLAIHFIAALGLLVYTYWFALRLLIPNDYRPSSPSSRNLLGWTIGLLVVQLIYGAFMAGLKAAATAPTWPDINGAYLPSSYHQFGGTGYSSLSALVNNPLVVHFIHRNLAYLITILILAWTFVKKQAPGQNRLAWTAWMPFLFVLIQVGLGIAAVITSARKVARHWGNFEWAAQLHQFVAIVLLLALVTAYYLQIRKGKTNY